MTSRSEVIREIKRQWRMETGRTLSDSDARAMLNGESDRASHTFAFRIARQMGYDPR